MTVPAPEQNQLKTALFEKVATEHNHLSPQSVQKIVQTMLRTIGQQGYTLHTVGAPATKTAPKPAAPKPAAAKRDHLTPVPSTRDDGTAFPVSEVIAPPHRPFNAGPTYSRSGMTDAEYDEYLMAVGRDTVGDNRYTEDEKAERDADYEAFWQKHLTDDDLGDDREPTDDELMAIDLEAVQPEPVDPPKYTADNRGNITAPKPQAAKPAAPKPVATKAVAKTPVKAVPTVPAVELPAYNDIYSFTVKYVDTPGEECETITFTADHIDEYQIGETYFADFQHETGETAWMFPTDRIVAVQQRDKSGAVKRVAEVAE